MKLLQRKPFSLFRTAIDDVTKHLPPPHGLSSLGNAPNTRGTRPKRATLRIARRGIAATNKASAE